VFLALARCGFAALFVFVITLAARAAPGGVRSLLLDGVVRPDGAVVAVGERGAILLSQDVGETWRAIPCPVEFALTGISFADASTGWICGHGGVILVTRDGGRQWERQLDEESSETIFLDVVALGPQSAVVVGAFGAVRVTQDGGRTWASPSTPGEDAHLNRILADRTGALWLAGERGGLFRSVDRGLTWERGAAPEDAPSLYGLLRLGSGELLVHGLRGHAWRVTADGQVADVAIESPVMLAASCELSSGTILLAGASRWFFVSEDEGHTFRRITLPLTTAVAELLPLPDGRVLALGEAGVSILQLPPRP
jgi:photosystem II stability/assembly factor-like uncharacterized protein